MTRVFQLPAMALAVLIPGVVSAQGTLTLDQAVQEALVHNASLRAVRAASAEDAARVSEARAAWLPRASITESWQRGDQPVFVFSSVLAARRFTPANFAIDALNHPDAQGFFHASFGVEQVLFDGGRRRSAVNGATLHDEMSGARADEAAAAVAVAVHQMFGRVLTSDAGRRASNTALDAAREDLARAQRRRDAGMSTDADVLTLSAQVAGLEQRVIESTGEAAIARAELNRLMGGPVTRTYDLREPAEDESSMSGDANLDALLAEAERNRPELRRAGAAERLADTDRQSVRAALLPEVAAQAGYEASGLRFAERTPAWLIGGEIRWNLSLGGAELARLKAMTEAQARAAAEAEDVRAAVQVEVVTALRRLEAARARRTAGRAAVEQARESQRIIRDRFDAGVAGVTDVLRASSAVLDAEAQRVSAVVDTVVSAAMLNRAVGRHP